jgi:FMN-dependent NADH-azoreductase
VSAPILGRSPPFDQVVGFQVVEQPDDVRRIHVESGSRGGGYGEGTPRHRWDHAEPWLPHAIHFLGLEPHFITAELALAHTNPAMAELIPLAHRSLPEAERAIDDLWTPESAVA